MTSGAFAAEFQGGENARIALQTRGDSTGRQIDPIAGRGKQGINNKH